MTSLVPSTSPSIAEIKVQGLDGFRGQESWGRWTLGKSSSIIVYAKQSTWIEVNIELVLPYAKQDLKILLNGQTLEEFKSTYRNSAFSLDIPINLKAGGNILGLSTNKSNMDESLTPFAPLDPTDIGIQINRIFFSKLRVLNEHSEGLLYGSVQNAYPLNYRTVLNKSVNLFFQRPGNQLLEYRLLRSKDGQSFDFRVDNQLVYSTNSGSRGSLAVGEIPLYFDKKVYHLSLISKSDIPSPTLLNDSIKTLEDINGSSSFYIQKLEVRPNTVWQHWALPLAIIGMVIFVSFLAFWLFGHRTSHTLDA